MKSSICELATGSLVVHAVRRRHRRRRRRTTNAQRVVVGFYCRGEAKGPLVDLRSVMLTVLREDDRGPVPAAIPVAGFAGRIVPWGVEWGGPELNVFEKDLGLPSQPGGPGRHFDSTRPRLLRHAAELHRSLQSAPTRHSQVLRLPKLWAAFRQDIAEELYGDGPELAQLSRQLEVRADALFSGVQRQHDDLALFPLDWVSHHWQQVSRVFVDISSFPKRQLLHLPNGISDLHGYRGAVHFDLSSSRFTPRRRAA